MENKTSTPTSQDMGNAFSQFIEIIKFNKGAMSSIARDEKATVPAAIFLLIGALAGPVANQIFGVQILGTVFRPDIQSTISASVVAVLTSLLTIFITMIVATKLFKGKGTFMEYFRVVGLAYALNILTILGSVLPALAMLVGLIVGLWMLAISFVAIKSVFSLDDTNAVLTIIVTLVAYLVLGAILVSVVASIGLSTLPQGGTVDLSRISY